MNKSISMKGITKSFSGIKALDNIDIDISDGKVHGLIGANGAGKSTLIKILAGVYQADEGIIAIDGEPVKISNPSDSASLGLAFIHQELNLVESFNIIENLTLGMKKTTRAGMIHWKDMEQRVKEVIGIVGLDKSIYVPVKAFTVAEQWLIAIAKALYQDAKYIAMDEPTAALSETEVERLFDIVRTLTARGIGVIYVSHRLDEIMTICDEITVFKDGKKVFAASVSDVSKEEIITAIAGHEVKTLTTVDYNLQDAKTVLEVAHLSDEKKVRDVSFSLKEGEVLGITGLVGAGRSELVLSVFGYNKIREGTLLLDGKEYVPKNPEYAVKRKLALVPENRRSEGLICSETVTFNINLPTLSLMRPFRHLPFIQGNKGRRISEEIVSKLQIKTKDVNEKVMHLSGGNQQKVVLGKWLKRQPRIIILDEPTQGVDVGARAEIYKLIREMAAKQKVSFIIVSSDVEEIPGLCDRVLVMVEGRISGELLGEDISKENILRFCYKHDQR